MEPVTHILTGACLARTGLNRKAAYTTAAMVIAAEFPDIDTLWSLRGPVDGFRHHRGITHTFLAVPFEAALIVGLLFAVHKWRLRRSQSPPRAITAAPVRWGLLYLFALIALLSHLLLDFTNNYGIRPFFPFNSHWYAASIVFIFDPLIFLLLLAALILPPIFRLVSAEVGVRREPFVARGWAAAALLAIVALWTFREVQHNHALQIAMQQTLAQPQPTSPDLTPSVAPPPPDPTPTYLQPQRVLASPDPLSPFRWYSVTDFGPLYQLANVDTRLKTYDPQQPLMFKPNASPVLRAAESSPLGRAYLDWSSMPYIQITPPADGSTLATVEFADPRFMGDALLLHTDGRTPLTAKVEVDPAGHIASQSMDGKYQH